jgi:hypothetical protein
MPPLERDRELSSRSENQKPAASRPAGVRKRTTGKGAPTLRHVVPQDLVDPERLLGLFDEACRAGLVTESEADRLAFFGMAVHARTHSRKNKCGMFVAGVKQRRWRFISLSEEDEARRMLLRVDASARSSKGSGRLERSAPRTSGSVDSPETIRRLIQDSLAASGLLERVSSMVSSQAANEALQPLS